MKRRTIGAHKQFLRPVSGVAYIQTYPHKIPIFNRIHKIPLKYFPNFKNSANVTTASSPSARAIMLSPLDLVSDPHFLLASNVNGGIPPNLFKLPSPIHNRVFPAERTAIVCAASRRNRIAIVKSGKVIVKSAYIIASYFRIIPEPVESILREFAGGNGGRNGFWSGYRRGGSGGWNRKSEKLGMMGILVILGAVGLWWIVGKELVSDSDAFLGGFGVILFGLSVEGLRRGAKDWILGFCCCAFLVGLVSSKGEFRPLLKSFGSLMKGGIGLRRK